MQFYPNTHPEVNEVTMCTVTSFDESIGFHVHLDEYDQDALLPLKELSAKKIRKSIASFLKINTQLPLCVMEVDDDGIVMTKKGFPTSANPECKERYGLNVKLFALARRIAFAILNSATEGKVSEENIDTEAIARIEGDWTGWLRDANSQDVELPDHLYNVLSNRGKLPYAPLSDVQIETLEQHFVTLFGIHPITEAHSVTIQTFSIDGMDEVKTVLMDIASRFRTVCSDDELYQNQSLANVVILPTAIPTFQINVTAYQRDHASRIWQDIQSMLKHANFNMLKFT